MNAATIILDFAFVVQNNASLSLLLFYLPLGIKFLFAFSVKSNFVSISCEVK